MADAVYEMVVKRESYANRSERKNLIDDGAKRAVAGFIRFGDVDLVGVVNDVPRNCEDGKIKQNAGCAVQNRSEGRNVPAINLQMRRGWAFFF